MAGGARALVASAVLVGLCQIALSARFPYADDYQLTLGIAWGGAAFLTWQRGKANLGDAPLALRLEGLAFALASVVALAIGQGYRAFDRVLPLTAGTGLACAASGRAYWKTHRTSLLLLALPIINPPPAILHRLLDPVLVPITTWSAGTLIRLASYPMTIDGSVIRMPNGALDVVDGCSGLWAIARLCVLVALVLALFPTSARQRGLLMASAVGVGLLVNAVRVAILAVTVMHKDPHGFRYWHEGPGATVFALGTSAVAGIVWWAVLRGGPGPSVEVSTGQSPAV